MKKRNKPSPEQAALLSAQEKVNIKDIKGSCLYTKDGFLFSFLKVQPVSTGLMSKEEKARLTRQMTAAISPLGSPFKLILLSRPTDVKQIIRYYETMKQTTPESNKRDSITKTQRYLSESSLSGGVLERQTFLAVWLPASGHTDKDVTELALQYRAALSSCGISSELLDEKSIVQMCSLVLNPNYSNTVSVYDNNYTFLTD